MENNYLKLVNRTHPLLQHDIPQHLVIAPFAEKDIYIHPVVAKNLKKLLVSQNLTQEIVLLDSYRTQNEQRKLWEESLVENGLEYTKEFVAYPGCSEHQTGLAIDVGLKRRENDAIAPYFSEKNKIVQKFLAKIQENGFILRYPKDKRNITGIGYEPWHFRYVGTPHSKIIAECGWTLEEYILFLENTYRVIA